MFTIGDFSKATGLPAKTLRFYHEKGLLVPAAIDRESGFRYYDKASLDRARIIISLRELEFSLEEIGTILAEFEDEGDILVQLEAQKKRIAEKIRRQQDMTAVIDRVIQAEADARAAIAAANFGVEEKDIDPLLVGGIRIKGRYSDCGPAFGTLGKKLGRHIGGKALCLYYDGEYREDDADFEPCMPLRKKVAAEGIDVRELPGAHCVTLLHLGSYEELGRSYAKVLEFVNGRDDSLLLPSREVYLKGPGMILKGNPRKYVTEIQLPVARS